EVAPAGSDWETILGADSGPVMNGVGLSCTLDTSPVTYQLDVGDPSIDNRRLRFIVSPQNELNTVTVNGIGLDQVANAYVLDAGSGTPRTLGGFAGPRAFEIRTSAGEMTVIQRDTKS